MKIFILGVNGFIGSNLSEHVLRATDWEISGMDLHSDKLAGCFRNKRFSFTQGDIRKSAEWIEEQVKTCDVVMPLVAIATPAAYIERPLEVFELAFEANLSIVRLCVKHKKRLLFPSTSEVYGMCEDDEFDEEESNLTLGPIHRMRWIYSCSKQMMDRVIYAYGLKEGLDYTIFRPFNWIGPKLDNIKSSKEGSSRALTQFIGNILRGEPIKLVGGGMQRRSFLYIEDAVGALMRILENKHGHANRRRINIGSQTNDVSIRELAKLLVELVGEYPAYHEIAGRTKIQDVTSEQYYGKGYQDAQFRMPAIHNAKKYLEWEPTTNLRTALKRTLDYYLVEQAS